MNELMNELITKVGIELLGQLKRTKRLKEEEEEEEEKTPTYLLIFFALVFTREKILLTLSYLMKFIVLDFKLPDPKKNICLLF